MDMQDPSTNGLPRDKLLEGNPLCIFNIFCMEEACARSVLVKIDHKHLEAIMKKPLNKASKRLQTILLRSQNYIYTIEWQKAAKQHIPYMLSRASLPNTEEEEENINMCVYLLIGTEQN